LARLHGRERLRYLRERLKLLTGVVAQCGLFSAARRDIYLYAVTQANPLALQRYAPRPYPGAVVLFCAEGRDVTEAPDLTRTGLVGGACSAGLIALVNTALNRADLSRTLLVVGFAGLVAAKVISSAVARFLLNRFTQRTLTDLCRDLSRKVLATPLRHLEHVGIPRILTTLTEDVAWIGWAAQNVPSLAMNMAVLAGCAIYLGWLSWPILLVVA